LNIAFDHQVFLLQKYGGISRYICELVDKLFLFGDINPRIFASLHSNVHLQSVKARLCSGVYISSDKFIKIKTIQLLSPIFSKMAMARFEPHIIHQTYYSATPFKLKNVRNVLTVYDMIHEIYSNQFNNSHQTTSPKRISSQRADHIICISENTRTDLMNIFGLSRRNISVVHLGVDHQFWGDVETEREAFSRPFLLYVGKRAGYKNFLFFLKVFSSSRILRNDFNIVCFGDEAFTSSELMLAKKGGLRSEQLIHIVGTDETLRTLYGKATALVYPSLYEGFGLPPLEAMASRCPVIVSNRSCLPEIVADAGQYFDPYDIDSARSAIENVVDSMQNAQQLIDKGLTRCKLFTWEKCATDTLAVYRRLV